MQLLCGRARVCVRTKTLGLLVLIAMLQACGGGGAGGAGTDTDPGPSPGPGPGNGDPPGPVVPGPVSGTVRFDTTSQRFVAAWEPASNAQRYRVLLKHDELTDFALLPGADNLASDTLSFSFAVGFTIQWQAAALRIEACNVVACSVSGDLPLLPELAAALAEKQFIGALDADELRVACSADGTVLAVGAPFDSGPDGLAPRTGAVYVFTRTGIVWNAQPTVVRAPNAERDDSFGGAVALSADGERLAVGAPHEDGSASSSSGDDDNDAPDAGAAYVFVRRGSDYEPERYLKAQPILDTALTGDLFGSSIAIAADARTVVVGAPFAESASRPLSFNDGAAFVFTRTGTVWTQRAALHGPRADGNEDDQFGLSVAISANGDTIASGAPFEDGDALSTSDALNFNAANAGAVYIFATTNRTAWPQQAYLKAPNAEAGDRLGMSVALSSSGNVVAAGATGEDGDVTSTLAASNDNLANAGAVYVFARTETTWSTTPAYLKPSSVSERADFGDSLSLSANGSAVAIGAPFDRSAPPLEGSAFVFVQVGSSWLEQIRFADTAASFEFGAVALSADGLTLFIGADQGIAAGGVHVH